MALLFFGNADRFAEWYPELHRALPDLEIRVYPEMGDLNDITYAIGFRPPPGVLALLTSLKAVFSTGAGVDGILQDPSLPPHVPVVRMVERGLTEGMTEYVAMHVLAWHRSLWRYARMQTERDWGRLPQVLARDRRVGIMGLGELGQDAARALLALRFQVSGWSRSPKMVDGVSCFAGEDGLDAFLARSEILVCLLPLTAETKGILNHGLFARLPRGAALINVARGGHLVEADLLAALQSGHVTGATLDVFDTEPLPADHVFWTHPQINVTPHVASLTLPGGAADEVARQIQRIEAGLPLENVVNRARGY